MESAVLMEESKKEKLFYMNILHRKNEKYDAELTGFMRDSIPTGTWMNASGHKYFSTNLMTSFPRVIVVQQPARRLF